MAKKAQYDTCLKKSNLSMAFFRVSCLLEALKDSWHCISFTLLKILINKCKKIEIGLFTNCGSWTMDVSVWASEQKIIGHTKIPSNELFFTNCCKAISNLSL
jgi:hypothetical protein